MMEYQSCASRPFSPSWLLLIIAISCVFASAVRAQLPEEELQKGIEEYLKWNYEGCLEILQRVAVSDLSSKDQKIEACVYMGASHYYLNEMADAQKMFEKSARLDASFLPPESNFSPDLLEFYRRVRSKLLVTLQITSTPPGAVVYIDNDSVGVTPYSASEFPVDTVSLVLRFKGKRCVEEQLSPAPGETNKYDFPLMCTLNISSYPPGATVTLNGVEVGTTNRSGLEYLSGNQYVMGLSRKGYVDTTETLNCLAGEIADISVNLTKKAKRDWKLRYWSGILSLGLWGGTLYLNDKVDGAYQKYANAIHPGDIREYWQDYENKQSQVSGAAVVSSALTACSITLWMAHAFSGAEKDNLSLVQTPHAEQKFIVGFDFKDGRLGLSACKRF